MGKKKVVKALEKALSEEYSRGFSDGWDMAKEDGPEEGSTYEDGWNARWDNVKLRLESLMDTYMTTRKFRDAQTVKEMIEYLNFFVPPFDEEKYREELEKDGF
jgi:flagellar biosynthesis/type III secretory pathway protein FliH